MHGCRGKQPTLSINACMDAWMHGCMDAWMQGLGVGVDGVARRAACEAALQSRHTELVGQGNARLLEYLA